MTAYEKLRIEIDGLSGTIDEYTSESKVQNMLHQLKASVDNMDIEKILYCLRALQIWYQNNMHLIEANQFVGVSEMLAHREYQMFINSIIPELEKEGIPDSIKPYIQAVVDSQPIIFLSHKSDDKKYGDALRNFIIGLGVPNSSLIYTSHSLHKIPLDKNIYDYLRDNITGNVFVIILWSDKYIESPACLNEMGAAWVTQKDYTNMYVPNFSFGNPKYHECAVDTRKMGAVLNGDANCKASMIEFKNKIQSLFNLKNDETNSQFLIDRFITEITEA